MTVLCWLALALFFFIANMMQLLNFVALHSLLSPFRLRNRALVGWLRISAGNSTPQNNLQDFISLLFFSFFFFVDWETWLWLEQRNVLYVCLTSATCRWVVVIGCRARNLDGFDGWENEKLFFSVASRTFNTWFVVVDIARSIRGLFACQKNVSRTCHQFMKSANSSIYHSRQNMKQHCKSRAQDEKCDRRWETFKLFNFDSWSKPKASERKIYFDLNDFISTLLYLFFRCIN